MSEKRSWYASGKERKPGKLLMYALIVAVGVVFAGVTIVLMFTGQAAAARGLAGMGLGTAVLWGAIAAAIAAAIGVIVYFVYMKLLVKK